MSLTKFYDEMPDIDSQRTRLSGEMLKKTLGRIFRYTAVRVLSVLLTIGLGIYLTLLVINLGGFVDEIMEGQISEALGMMGMSGAFNDIPVDEREAYIENLRWQMEEAAGLHEPLPIRTARWWWNSVSLQWGNAERMQSLDRQSTLVKDVIFSRLPYTLLLVGAANVLLFFFSLWVAMLLSSKQGKFWDRLLVTLTPISSAPAWVHGIILLAIFALELRILPFKGVFDGLPPDTRLQYIAEIARHMALPVLAIILSVFFQGVYTWRTFFMVHSGEDYVDLAKAKGLPDRIIRRRYLLRPTLPSVITSFAMMLVSFWEEAIALELLFDWPGLGAGFFRAVRMFDRPVVVAIVVMFAYLLGLSVLLLDVVYALIDPRVRIGKNGTSVKMRSVRKKKFGRWISQLFNVKWAAQHQKRPENHSKIGVQDQGQTRPIMVGRNQKDSAQPLKSEGTRPIVITQDVADSGLRKPSDDTQPLRVSQANPAGRRPNKQRILPPESSSKLGKKQTTPSGVEDTKPYGVKQKNTGFLKTLFQTARKNIFNYPMAVVGLVMIVVLFVVAIGTVIAIPYDEAVEYWHSEGWLFAPKYARPVWTNFFRREKWPESLYFDSTQPTDGVEFSEERVWINENMLDIRMTFDFELNAGVFPQDLAIYYQSTYDEKAPFTSLIMVTPDGRETEINSFKAIDGLGYILSHEDKRYVSKEGPSAVEEIFGDPETAFTKPLKGHYQLQVLSIVFEEGSDVDVQGALHGRVYGLFGTDFQRRDLTVAMLWGTPVALTFGILGAVLTTVSTIFIAAFSAWYGGSVDEILQRITELNITLPALPIAILVFILYSKSIWVILAVMILMNIFGNSLKEYRAMFLQFKEAPYIEAAKAYGSTNRRIVFRYMLPRIIQVMVPQLVISVPSFVFLEATLAYLGVSSPYLPTWGKVIHQALNQGTFWGYYYWVLEPIVLVLITGLAFAFVGVALDKILNPRLRSR